MDYKHNNLQALKFIKFIYKKAFETSKTFWIFIIISSLINSITSLIWVIIPKYIIDELNGDKREDILILYVLIFVIALIVFGLIQNLINNHMDILNNKIDIYFRKQLYKKVMNLEYEHFENPKTLDLKDRATVGLNYWGGISNINQTIISIISTILTIGTLIVLIINLNIIFAIILLLIIVSKTLLNNRLRIIVLYFWDKLGIFNRQYRYLVNIMMNYRYGKDIRLYNMSNMILDKAEVYKQQTLAYYEKQGKLEKKFLYTQNFLSLIQNLTIYGFTIYFAHKNDIGIGSLVMYITAATNIINSSTSMTQNVIDLKRICQYATPYMTFINLPEPNYYPKESIPKEKEYKIEFRNVEFKYPGSDVYVLKNVSFTISHQEKISIVGINGAGKTTLIKLLLRLYNPTSGEIFINGVNINEYSYEEYLEMFSVVFQDFRLLATSISENIASNEISDENRIWETLEKVNLKSKCEILDKKLDTQLFKNFHLDGIELSGGEFQKLAIARAIYKNSYFVILDEPTSNLDPISEYEIYKNFDALVSYKTTIYISHRLSTCRLSDKIIVIKDGEIIEEGKHQDLIKNHGLYEQMWSAQSKYYVKESKL